MLALLALALVAVVPVPQPTATNPFTLDPTRPATSPPLPIIGTTHNRPVCTALRQAVKPALQAAMKNDVVYGAIRKNVFSYLAYDTEVSRDLHLMQMDQRVNDLVDSTDALESALKSHGFDIPATASPDDAKRLRELHDSLQDVLVAQKVQLNALSGFVETERQRRFAKLDETGEAMRQSVAAPGQTTAPFNAFLPDRNGSTDVFAELRHPAPEGLRGANLIDRDLGEINAVTTQREARATTAIVSAAKTCQ